MIWISEWSRNSKNRADSNISSDQARFRELISKGTAITVGNFDGIHVGHRKLIGTLLERASNQSLSSVVYTFRPHPRVVLRPELPFFRLFDQLDQKEVLEQLGVDVLYEENFTREMAGISATDYFEQRWLKGLNLKELIVGYDFSFGKDRQGNIEFLKQICLRHQVKLTIVDAFSQSGEIVSSSTIRRLLQHGEVERAGTFLGRNYYLRGEVVRGFQRGRLINVPTANIHPDIHFLPRRGVYFTRTTVGPRTFYSITNIGFNPTFQSRNQDDISQLKVETHLIDFNEDIYNSIISVELLHFHRDEMKFSSIDQLKNQIQTDIESCRSFFARANL